MPVLRFPNSQSDLDRLVRQMTLVAEKFPNASDSFSLDDIRDVLASQSQISSSGASGALAVSRSTREDRSRDPLYNQVKMMSEIYRMFGWMRSTTGNRLDFRMTHLGLTIALDSSSMGIECRNGLIRESILGVVFPNETTTNVGVFNQRPFSWLLRLSRKLDGFITRDEIIVGLLGTIDDLVPGEIESVTTRLESARKRGNTAALVEQLANTNKIQVNTLQNYTRLPIGILSSELTGWASPSTRNFEGFKSPVRGFELTAYGKAVTDDLENSFDLRLAGVRSLSDDERALLADFAFYSMLENAGVPNEVIKDDIERLRFGGHRILTALGFTTGQKLLFSPELQETDLILAKLGEE